MKRLNENLLALLSCPKSNEPLEIINDEEIVAKYTEGLNQGRYYLQSLKLPKGEITGFLKNLSGEYVYPIVNMIPILTPQSNIVDSNPQIFKDNTGSNSIDDALEKSFQAQMNAYSKRDECWYKDLHQAIQNMQISHYYSRFAGKDILDVGNGGISLQDQMGEELASQVRSFVSVDKSYPMLNNSPEKQNCVLGDGMALPFADNSFDFVMFNGVIHHLGRKRNQPRDESIKKFCSECLRVSRKGIIFSDFFIPTLGEWVESLIVLVLGQMATYVYSKKSLFQIFNLLGYSVSEVKLKPITTLIPPLQTLPPILFLEWLRVPAFIIPYTFVFGVISKSKTSQD